MKYTLPKSYSNAGLQVEIPDEYLSKNRAAKGTKAAICDWLVENGYMRRDEYDREQANTVAPKRKSPTRKPDDTKAALISLLYSCLLESDVENVEVVKPERLIAFTLGDDSYELTLTRKRKTK